MRIRQIKPQFWINDKLGQLSRDVRLVAISLLSWSDDEGYFNANEHLIKTQLFPFDDNSLNVHGILSELSNIDYIRICEGSDGRKYGRIVNWATHQKPNRPSPSIIKPLCNISEDSVNAHESLTVGKGLRKGDGKGNINSRKSETSDDIHALFPNEVLELEKMFEDSVPQNVTEKERRIWCDILDKCIRLDNRPLDELRQVIMWGRNDSFWEANFRSPRKLREKNKDGVPFYDVFLEKMGRSSAQKNNTPEAAVNQYIKETRGI